jgi:branched-chain amino acid aminotransferase
MSVFLNGEFVPEDQAVVSVFDRSFRYGDGLFEAVLISNGKLFRWPQHFERLRRSAAFVKIPLHLDEGSLRDAILELARRNRHTEGIARVTLSRGVGPRGYVPSGNEKPNVVITTDPLLPFDGTLWSVVVSRLRVAAGDALAQHKTQSRILNVLASMEARERGAHEALLVDTNGHITEGATSNLFWLANGTLNTTPLGSGILPGITRAATLELCAARNIRVAERTITPAELRDAEAVFLTMSSRGIAEVGWVDALSARRLPVVSELARAFQQLIREECR